MPKYSSNKTQCSGSTEKLLSVTSVLLEDGSWGLEVRLRFNNGDATTIQVSDAQAVSPKLFERAVLHKTGRPFNAAAAIGERNSGLDQYLPRKWRKEVSRHWGHTLWSKKRKRRRWHFNFENPGCYMKPEGK